MGFHGASADWARQPICAYGIQFTEYAIHSALGLTSNDTHYRLSHLDLCPFKSQKRVHAVESRHLTPRSSRTLPALANFNVSPPRFHLSAQLLAAGRAA